jgi:replicative superfamily II helicase
MVKRGLISEKIWYENEHIIEVTDQGRRQYEESKKERLGFPIPYPVKMYLDQRKPKVGNLFPIQQTFVDRGLLHSRNNVCVFGYPGSGKTLVAEMGMANELDNSGRALYCTPYKALDWQKYNDFSECFGKGLRKKVVIADGDNPVRISDLLEADIIIATYERVHGAVRNDEQWLDGITLVCADEITLLDDKERGGGLDVLLTHLRLRDNPPRLITLSSLIGNPLQISEWLDAEAIIENRPLPEMEVHEYLVFKQGNKLTYLSRDGKRFDEEIKGNVIEHISRRSLEKKETTLIFVGSRPQTELLGRRLRASHQYNQQLAERAKSFFENEVWEKTQLTKSLCELIGYGIAFHHAGVQRKARKFVESLLRENALKTVVATTTLSHGVDYSIDNVIIDLPTILRIHELHGYEYINLKGRTGRPGKSQSASVYILANEKLARKVFDKYFLGSPEAIGSSSTFEKEVIATMILTEAGRTGISVDKIMEKLNKTLCAATKTRPQKSFLKETINELVRFGFLKKKNGFFVVSELGKKVNETNLSPYDAKIVIGIPADISTADLLEVASNIYIAKRMKRNLLLPFGEEREILVDWMNEASLDSIKAKYGSSYDDQDIIDLGEYASSSIEKISSLASDSRLKKRLKVLKERVRYGIKSDMVESGLMILPSLSRDKKRSLARLLFSSGIDTVSKLAKENAESLSKDFGIEHELAGSLINNAKESTNGQNKKS